ncbi:wat1-related protein at3g28050 [Phtheirospermum japonicum]|uniref:Wat1-related protein at3g28050 n=1 Tax=Phtheirospermum japonicum TaxID=374723 RepID=A0A830CAH9_9LAMI|nr:wat1-related protein at3g28050 [Phtheirospermum japonicum]
MATRQWPWIESSLPVLGMVSAVVALAVNQIISKMVMSKGTSFYILSVYSNGLATLIVFPTAFLFHRCFAEIGSYAGINYSSPTLSTAMLILVPAFTYILAIIFRMEQANFGSLSTIAKSLGTVVSISGAFIVTFYKGPAILNSPLTFGSFSQLYLPVNQNWVLGGFLLACASFMTASWCILQAAILKMYPAEMIIVAFYCLFVTIQSSLVTLIAERDLAALRIETKIGLFAVFYAAIINIAYRLYVTAWCIWKTGPFFVSLFKPLTVVIAIVIGVIFMKDVLYLGSLVGAVVLICGFYAVMWGKAKEREITVGTESSGYRAPLLQDDIEEASARPPLFLTFLCGFFLLGFIGFLVQILGYTGLLFASPSLSITILNLIPGFTFVFAVIFRMEKFNYTSSTTMAKSIGTLVSVIGAIIITLYQGPPILGISSHSNASSSSFHTLTSSSAWLIGGFILTIDCMVSALFIITQAVILRKCPAELILMLFYSCFIAIFSGAVSLIVEKDFSAWSLKSKMRLIPVIYSAIFGNAFQVSIIMWCVRRRGPVFASLFHPLGVIFAIALGIIILGEAFYLGSLVGSIVTVVGFYCVIWGKAKEAKMNKDGPKSSEPNDKRVPLLQNNTGDEIVIA